MIRRRNWWAALALCLSSTGCESRAHSAKLESDGGNPTDGAAVDAQPPSDQDATTTDAADALAADGGLDVDASDSSVDDGGTSPQRDASTATDIRIVLAPDSGIDPSLSGNDGGALPDYTVGPTSSCSALGSSSDVLFDLIMPESRIGPFGRDTFLLSATNSTGQWGLFDSRTYSLIARGTRSASALAGNTLVTHAPQGADHTLLELRDTADGRVLGTILSGPSVGIIHIYGVAVDGSYIFTLSDTLRIWSRTGALLHTFPKESLAGPGVRYAAPTELRSVSSSRAPTCELTRVSIPSGTLIASTPIIGQFPWWFADGEHFVTQSADGARIYSAAGTQVALIELPTGGGSVEGFGNYYWLRTASSPKTLTLYELSRPGQSILTLENDSSVSSLQGLTWTRDGKAHVLDLTGATPILTETTLPAAHSLASARPNGDLLLRTDGNSFAVLPAGSTQVRPFTCGHVITADLSPGGTWALGVAAGQIFTGNLADRSTATLLPLRARRVEVADDGKTMLVVLNNLVTTPSYDPWVPAVGEFPIALYSLPGGALVRRLGKTSDFSWFGYVQGGTRVATLRCDANTVCTGTVQTLDGATTDSTWTIAAQQKPVYAAISPSGARAALSVDGSSYIYQSGTLVGSANLAPGYWIDEDRLLVFRLAGDVDAGGVPSMIWGSVIDSTGSVRETLARLDELNGPPLVNGLPAVDFLAGGTRIFPHNGYAIRDLATGWDVWSPTVRAFTSPLGDAAANDSTMIYSIGTQVLAVPHP